MHTHTTTIPNEKLSEWLFAVSHAVWVTELRIKHSKEHGFDTSYDTHHLEAMQDLHMFLQMSWDQWLESFSKSAPITVTEAKTHA